MIDWGVVLKMAVSALGFALLAFGQSYNSHPDAKLIMHGAAVAVAIGSYLTGLFQERPVASIQKSESKRTESP